MWWDQQSRKFRSAHVSYWTLSSGGGKSRGLNYSAATRTSDIHSLLGGGDAPLYSASYAWSITVYKGIPTCTQANFAWALSETGPAWLHMICGTNDQLMCLEEIMCLQAVMTLEQPSHFHRRMQNGYKEVNSRRSKILKHETLWIHILLPLLSPSEL